MKKQIALLLVTAMLITMLPLGVSAAGGICGDNVTWSLDSNGNLTISGSGRMTDFSSDGAPWYQQRESIKTITIGSGVTYIGQDAFDGCNYLTKVTIPNTVTEIGEYAFFGCFSLTNVTIPNSVVYIRQKAFNTCVALQSITIPNSVTEIGYGAFSGCYKATKLTLGSGVSTIGMLAFSGCERLTEVSIPAGVTEIGYGAFNACAALKAIRVAENNASFSGDARGVLFNKDKTTLIKCPDALSGTYTIPTGVTQIDESAFYRCKSLTGIVIPDSVTAIGSKAFQECEALTGVIIPASVTSIGDSAFSGCSRLTDAVIPSGVAAIPASAFSLCRALSSVTVPGSVTTIGLGAFNYCDNLKTVYYAGSEQERARLSIQQNNEAFQNANWICASAGIQRFLDVKPGKFYYDTVMWAVDRGVTSGKTAITFEPEEACTRAQVVTFLWRANGCPRPSSTNNPFVDVPSGKFYTDAVLWAAEKQITGGLDGTHFAPEKTVSRAEFVTFLYRAKGAPLVTGMNPFTDVKLGMYYTKPVIWAVTQRITSGINPTQFAPNDPCTRGQVVTFLCRAYQSS